MHLNALTIDVEDYFQVTAFEKTVRFRDWSLFESRVERNTEVLLDLLDRFHTRATFFVLGWVAENHPHIVRRIHAAGHEVASHGYSHALIYRQSQREFRDETQHAKRMLEDIIQAPVDGYRAASYSITERSLWALDVLVELGYRWDSSIFPVRHDFYGMPDSPRTPYRISTGNGSGLVEFPLSTVQMAGQNVPVAGGGYFRLFPYWFTRWALRRINQGGSAFVFYVHPWEIDPDQPRIEAGWLSRFRHYNNLDQCLNRLEKLFSEFSFAPVSQILHRDGWLSPVA